MHGSNHIKSSLLFVKYTVKKRKNKHNHQLKKVNLNMEYWLGNTKKLESLRLMSVVLFSVEATVYLALYQIC